MNTETPFSYACHACGRCCHYKRIQVNPYEILRLARNRGLTTGEFIATCMDAEGPYLKVLDSGACVFLSPQGCQVHPDRPLPCRTYPLGRFVSAEGVETYQALKPHPESEGVYGRDGKVGDYLDAQGADHFSAVADRYQALFYRLFDALQEAVEQASEGPGDDDGDDESAAPPTKPWLDIDAMVDEYCAEHGMAVPTALEEKLNLHLAAIDEWVQHFTGEPS